MSGHIAVFPISLVIPVRRLLVSLPPGRHSSSPICHSIFSELYRKKSRDNVMGDLPDIDATELSSEQGAIYDQIIARPVTGAVLSLCSCEMPSCRATHA